jgi:hypothetical protein
VSVIRTRSGDSFAAPDADALLTRATIALADEHLAAFASHLKCDDQERNERKAVIDRFQAIPRTDFCKAWNRAGAQFGTPLWKAAAAQKVAEVSDEIFRVALKYGAAVGLPWAPATDMKPPPVVGRRHGLTALCDQAEREWRRAHLAAVREQGPTHA